MSKKQITTTIDKELYEKIKEKNLKISDLIYYGYIYLMKERKVLNRRYIESILNRLENIVNNSEILKIENIKNNINDILEYLDNERNNAHKRYSISKYDYIMLVDNLYKKLREILEKI